MRLLQRRAFLQLATSAVAPPALSGVASAEVYPSRPIRLVVPFPAGGVVDLYGRLIGQWLSERPGQPVIVENRVGVTGNLGTDSVVRAAPDGCTLLQTRDRKTGRS